MEDPKRMTKRRAGALLEFARRGLEEEAASLRQLYGVRVTQDKRVITLEIEDAELLTAEEKQEMDERVSTLEDLLAAMAIVQRRYT